MMDDGLEYRAVTTTGWHVAKVMLDQTGKACAVHFACPRGNPDATEIEWSASPREDVTDAIADLEAYVRAGREPDSRGGEGRSRARTEGPAPATPSSTSSRRAAGST